MAVYKLFPYKDTSLYSMYPAMNTGIDPMIFEVKFPNSDIKGKIVNI